MYQCGWSISFSNIRYHYIIRVLDFCEYILLKYRTLNDGLPNIQCSESQMVDNLSSNNGSNRVGRAVTDISNGIHASINANILLIDNESQHRQEGCVNEGNTKANDANWQHQDKVIARKGNNETGDAFED